MQFLGGIRRKMSKRGQPIRVASGGNFVVQPEARSTLAGLHLLKAYVAGDQDLSLTDSANNISRDLLERLGFRTILPLAFIGRARCGRVTTPFTACPA